MNDYQCLTQFFCPRWGCGALSWDAFCKRVQRAGYDGFEVGVASIAEEAILNEVWNTAEKYRLKIIVQHYDTYTADFSEHYDRYCAWLNKVKDLPCVKINSQTGKDYFTFEQNGALIAAAFRVSAQNRVQIVHETHRNKFSFAAHVTRAYLEKIPELKITLDVSHWVCVAESFLEDQEDAMQLAVKHTEHLHARVGYPCGPQVPDPRVKEWQYALNVHLDWWDKVIERKKREKALLTITPEFGPYPYIVHLPGKETPVCNQWEVNIYMMELLRKRYG